MLQEGFTFLFFIVFGLQNLFQLFEIALEMLFLYDLGLLICKCTVAGSLHPVNICVFTFANISI